MDALTLALRNNDSGPEISVLEDGVRVCCLNRENSVARYESHIAGHATLKAAGSGSAR